MTVRILGIDPGLRVTGFGVIEQHGKQLVYVASGCIKSNDKQSLPERIATLFAADRTLAPQLGLLPLSEADKKALTAFLATL